LGSPPAARRSWPALDVRLPASRASLLPDLLLAGLDDFQPSGLQQDDGGNALRVFFRSADARDRACAALRQTFEADRLSIEPVEILDEDWAGRSQSDLHGIVVGRLVVTPPWDREAVRPTAGAITIVIEPSMGFGTGHHATTRLCLLALQTLDLRGRRVLDLGTGSGILAIAAVRLGATHAIGLDTDPDALASARDSLDRNGIVDAVDLQLRDFREISGLSAPVVLANLTGAQLTRSAAQLTSLVESKGYLIASGFTEGETTVLPSLEAGLSRVGLTREDEWLCAILQRARRA
jgi:ribosomal protein L11 methyltransferase